MSDNSWLLRLCGISCQKQHLWQGSPAKVLETALPATRAHAALRTRCANAARGLHAPHKELTLTACGISNVRLLQQRNYHLNLVLNRFKQPAKPFALTTRGWRSSSSLSKGTHWSCIDFSLIPVHVREHHALQRYSNITILSLGFRGVTSVLCTAQTFLY